MPAALDTRTEEHPGAAYGDHYRGELHDELPIQGGIGKGLHGHDERHHQQALGVDQRQQKNCRRDTRAPGMAGRPAVGSRHRQYEVLAR